MQFISQRTINAVSHANLQIPLRPPQPHRLRFESTFSTPPLIFAFTKNRFSVAFNTIWGKTNQIFKNVRLGRHFFFSAIELCIPPLPLQPRMHDPSQCAKI